MILAQNYTKKRRVETNPRTEFSPNSVCSPTCHLIPTLLLPAEGLYLFFECCVKYPKYPAG